MKRKIFKLGAFILGLCSLLSFSANKDVRSAEATKGKGDEVWSLIGAVIDPETKYNSNWGKDFDFEYNASVPRYELRFDLHANEQFKIRLNHKWKNQTGGFEIGWDGQTNGGKGDYLSGAGSNFNVKEDGSYLLKIDDNEVMNYTYNYSYAFTIEKLTAVEHTVTYYSGSTKLGTQSIIDGNPCTLSFYEKEGYRLVGYYTDAALTAPFVKGTPITKDTNLYAKYEAATDYTLLLNDKIPLFSSKVCAYMWRGNLDDGNNGGWPGVEIKKNADGYYEIPIDASQSYDHIIFNNGSSSVQTADLDMSGAKEGSMFVIDGTSDNFTATLTEVEAKPETVDVKYFDGSTQMGETVQVNKSEAFYPLFHKKAGYRLEGYYTDASLKTPFVKGAVITENTNLYAKYVKAEKTTVYIDLTAAKWDATDPVTVYCWSENFHNENAGFPGNANGLVEISKNFYAYTLDGQDSYNNIIIAKGSKQTKNVVNIDYAWDGTLVVRAADGANNDVDYIAKRTEAHIEGELIAMYVDHLTSGEKQSKDEPVAPTNAVSIISYQAGEYVFENPTSQADKEAALKDYFSGVLTCEEYENYEKYVELVNSVEGGRELTINETVGDKGQGLKIGDKLDYMGMLYTTKKPSTVSASSNILSSITTKSNAIWLVVIISVLGLTSIAGYYFINKKRLAK